jgi:hypothetical protein
MTDCSLTVVNATDYVFTLLSKAVAQSIVFDDVSWSQEPSQTIAPRGSDKAGAAGVGLAKPTIFLTYRIECGAANGWLKLTHNSGTILDPRHTGTSREFSDDITTRFFTTYQEGLDATITIHQGIEP